MKKINLGLIPLMVMVVLGTSWSRAQSGRAGTNRTKSTVDSSGQFSQQGWAGYLGGGVGYSGYNSNLNVEGAPMSVKVLASYVLPEATGVFDAGFGVQNQSFSQTAAVDSSMSTGVMELAARYQFVNRWQLGGVYNQFFGKGANYSANQADALFGGIQFLREFSFGGNYLARVGGRLMTSLNVNNDSVNMAIVDFQIGWDGSNRSSSQARIY